MAKNYTEKIYDNIKMLDKNGYFLSFVNRKKMNYYLKNQLAEAIDSKSFKILFDPQFEDKPYNNSVFKKNQCVVCGSKSFIKVLRLIPLRYLKYIDKNSKSKGRIDHVVAACARCHKQFDHIFYQYEIDYVKKNCSEAWGHINNIVKPALSMCQKARAYCYVNMPLTAQASLYNYLCDYFGNNLIYNQIKEFADSYEELKPQIHIHDLFWEAKVNELGTSGAIDCLKKLFFDTMKPQFMPEKENLLSFENT